MNDALQQLSVNVFVVAIILFVIQYYASDCIDYYFNVFQDNIDNIGSLYSIDRRIKLLQHVYNFFCRGIVRMIT